MDVENPEVDLFGDAVVAPREGPGRPEHKWSRANSNKVLLSFALGRSQKEAAIAIGVSVPTLRKVYFSECAKRAAAALRMELTQLARLNGQAEAGNVAAEKELAKQIEKIRQRDQHRAVAVPAPLKAPKLGKKEAARQAAAQADGLYKPRAAPAALLQ